MDDNGGHNSIPYVFVREDGRNNIIFYPNLAGKRTGEERSASELSATAYLHSVSTVPRAFSKLLSECSAGTDRELTTFSLCQHVVF